MEEKRKYKTPQARYDATHTRRIALKLNLKTDADILEALDNGPDPIQTTIKRCLRQVLLGKNQ